MQLYPNEIKIHQFKDLFKRNSTQFCPVPVSRTDKKLRALDILPGCTIYTFPARVQRITVQRSHAGIIVREPGNEATQMLLEEASTRSGTIGFAPEKYNCFVNTHF